MKSANDWEVEGITAPSLSIDFSLTAQRPLHGIPILVKDNIVTKDKLDASAGSFVLLGAKPALESSLVSKLRQAGAIILGKTNLSEWANFRGLNNSVGWSPRGKQTFGAYYPGSRSDGSSSGSAVATALGLCVTALGTEVRKSDSSQSSLAGLTLLYRHLAALLIPQNWPMSWVSNHHEGSSQQMGLSPFLGDRMSLAPSHEQSRMRPIC